VSDSAQIAHAKGKSGPGHFALNWQDSLGRSVRSCRATGPRPRRRRCSASRSEGVRVLEGGLVKQVGIDP
jgi:hypothetical protein